MPQKQVGKRSSIICFIFGHFLRRFCHFHRYFFARLLLPDSFCCRVSFSAGFAENHGIKSHFYKNGSISIIQKRNVFGTLTAVLKWNLLLLCTDAELVPECCCSHTKWHPKSLQAAANSRCSLDARHPLPFHYPCLRQTRLTEKSPKSSQNVLFCPICSFLFRFVLVPGPKMNTRGQTGENGTFRDNLGNTPIEDPLFSRIHPHLALLERGGRCTNLSQIVRQINLVS